LCHRYIQCNALLRTIDGNLTKYGVNSSNANVNIKNMPVRLPCDVK
jgi:hypothetical protein